MLLAIFASLALSLTAPAPPTPLQATPASFSGVLSAAKPGDTIQLVGAGDQIAITGRTFSPPVNIDLTKATLHRLVISKSAGVRVIGGQWLPADVKQLAWVTNSSDIAFDGPVMEANQAATCFTVADTSVIAITGGHLYKCFQGVNLGRVTGATVAGNAILGTNNDSIVVVNTAKARIEFNEIGGNLRLDGRHPDAIQFFTKDGGRNSDIYVGRNMISGHTQGVFGGGIDRGLFEFNTIMIDHGNALSVGDCQDCTLRNNHVSTLPGAAQIANMNYWLPTAVRCGNVIEPYLTKRGLTEAACQSGF